MGKFLTSLALANNIEIIIKNILIFTENNNLSKFENYKYLLFKNYYDLIQNRRIIFDIGPNENG
jgi:hypothetical protein